MTRSAPSISFEYHRPRRLGQAGWVMLALSLGALFDTGLPWVLKLGGATVLLFGAWSAQCRHSREPARQFIWHEDGHWTAQVGQGPAQSLRLMRWRHWGSLWVLEFAPCQGRRFGVWLAPSEFPAASFRRLQQRLRRGHGLSLAAASKG